MADRVSIRDLAKLAGVSRTTVSLALRSSHVVAPETRKRILALAEEHGYRSHPAVNALMQQVGRGQRVHDEEVIAFIRSGSEPGENAAGPLEILAGAQQEAHLMGYRVEVFWAGYMASQSEQLARVLYHRGIRGVIWGPMPYPHPPIQFPWQRFVPIACSYSAGVPYLPVVSIQHAKGMALVLEELHRRGAGRIGFAEYFLEDSRHDFGWQLGVDLYQHRGGSAKIFTRILKEETEDPNLLPWARKQKLDALVTTPALLNLNGAALAEFPLASLDVARLELGQIGGLYQDTVQLGRHAIRSLSLRLSNGILGLPETSFSVVAQASFMEGKSLGRFQPI